MKPLRLVAALTLTLVPALVSAAEPLRQSVDRTLPLKPGQRFALANTNGSVTIEAWNRPEVRIQAVKHVKARDAAYAREVMSKLQVQISPSAAGVAVATVSPHLSDNFFQWLAGQSADAWVTYKIHVPQNIQLAIDTVNGSVTATAVSGDLKIETVNGRISLARAAGRLDLSTVNGAIKADMRELTARGSHSIETTNGGVTLRLPGNARAQLDIKTHNGAIESEFATTVSQSSKRSLKAAINGGGASVMVRTTNGRVTIAKS